jgi:hypothetical protein
MKSQLVKYFSYGLVVLLVAVLVFSTIAGWIIEFLKKRKK